MIQKKVCMLGASAVGKTSLVKKFVEGIFSEKYLTSIGVKVDKKRVDLAEDTVQLMLWDIEGVDRYSGFNPRYLRGAAAAIIVVDQTRPQSLEDGLEILRMTKENGDIPVFLVVNKNDLPASKLWNCPSESDFISSFDDLFKTSAKSGDGVDQMFTEVAQKIIDCKANGLKVK